MVFFPFGQITTLEMLRGRWMEWVISWAYHSHPGHLVACSGVSCFPAVTECMRNCTPAQLWSIPELDLFGPAVALWILGAGLGWSNSPKDRRVIFKEDRFLQSDPFQYNRTCTFPAIWSHLRGFLKYGSGRRRRNKIVLQSHCSPILFLLPELLLISFFKAQ